MLPIGVGSQYWEHFYGRAFVKEDAKYEEDIKYQQPEIPSGMNNYNDCGTGLLPDIRNGRF